jgi:CubicO group peptidase (beta-lactamase class C family)
MVVTKGRAQMNAEALRATEELFFKQIENRLHPGAAMAVYHHGELVLDLFGGVADAESGKPVVEDTLFVLYSCTKPLAAFGLYLLWERGKLGWDDPVAKYWPEFAKKGKDAVTVRHVMTHQAGFPKTPADLPGIPAWYRVVLPSDEFRMDVWRVGEADRRPAVQQVH